MEQLERRVLADRQGLIASGVREDLPDPGVERQRLNEALCAEPEELTPVDREQLELWRALGVA